jgi:hypothetical protein
VAFYSSKYSDDPALTQENPDYSVLQLDQNEKVMTLKLAEAVKNNAALKKKTYKKAPSRRDLTYTPNKTAHPKIDEKKMNLLFLKQLEEDGLNI